MPGLLIAALVSVLSLAACSNPSGGGSTQIPGVTLNASSFILEIGPESTYQLTATVSPATQANRLRGLQEIARSQLFPHPGWSLESLRGALGLPQLPQMGEQRRPAQYRSGKTMVAVIYAIWLVIQLSTAGPGGILLPACSTPPLLRPPRRPLLRLHAIRPREPPMRHSAFTSSSRTTTTIISLPFRPTVNIISRNVSGGH